MFKLYGKRPRCLWCGKANKENYREIVITIKKASPPQEEVVVCSKKCEKAVLNSFQFIEKNIHLFFSGVILGILLALSGLLAPIIGRKVLLVSFTGMLLLGMTFVIFPFVTPQTTKIFGLRNGMFLGRVTGIVFLLLGIVLILKI